MADTGAITFLSQAFRYQLDLHRLELDFRKAQGNTQAVSEELDDLWPHVRKVFQWCADRVDSDVRAAIACDKIAGVAGHLFERSYGRLQLIEWREIAVAATERAMTSGKLPDDPAYDMVHDLLGHLSYLGYLHLANRNHTRARQVLERAMAVGQAHDRHFADGAALLHLAFVAIAEGRLDEAHQLLERALALDVEADPASTQGPIRMAMGVILGRQGRHEAACAQYDMVISLSEGAGDRDSLCTALVNRSGEHIELGRLGPAGDDLARASALAEQLSSPGHRGLVRANKARLLAHLNPEDGAAVLEMLEGAMEQFSASGDRMQRDRLASMLEDLLRSVLERTSAPLAYLQRRSALQQLAGLASERGDAAQALDWSRQLLAASDSEGDEEDRVKAMSMVTNGLVATGLHGDGLSLGQRALRRLLAQPRAVSADVAEALEVELRSLVGQCLRHTGELAGAHEQLRAGLDLAERLGDEGAALRLRGNLGLTLVDQGQFDEALDELRAARDEARRGDDHRTLGLTTFNVAYALYRMGQVDGAMLEAELALSILDRIADPSAIEVRRQRAEWGGPPASAQSQAPGTRLLLPTPMGQ